jgi:hypothetical protein
LAAICFVNLAATQPAQASLAMQSVLGTVGIGTTSSSPTTVGFGGKKWIVIGYNGAGIQSERDTATLLGSNGDFGRSKFRSSGYPFIFTDNTPLNYEDGELHIAMQGIFDSIRANDPRESALIMPVDLEDTKRGLEGIVLNDQYVWPLSNSEAASLNIAVRASWGIGVDWWLRSPGMLRHFATFVYDRGVVLNHGTVVDLSLLIRPALKLNISPSVFVSAANGSRFKLAAGSALSPVKPLAAADVIKFTALYPGGAISAPNERDGGAYLTVVFDEATNNSGSLLFRYADALTGPNRHISCVLVKNNEIAYYGKLANCNARDSGALHISLAGVDSGIYALKIFCEQINPDYFTDFAGAPVVMSLNVSNGKGTVEVTPQNDNLINTELRRINLSER